MFDPSDPSQTLTPAANGAAATMATPPVEALLFGAGMISADQLGDLVRDAAISQQPVASVALERGLVTLPMLRTLLEQAGVDPSSIPGVPVETFDATPSEPAMIETFAPAPVLDELPEAPAPAFEQPTVLPVPAPEVTAAVAAAVAAAAPDAGMILTMPNGHALEAPPTQEEPALRLAMNMVAEAAPSPEPVFEPAEPSAAPAPSAEKDGPTGRFVVMVRLQGGERLVAGSAADRDAAAASAHTLAARFAEDGDWPLVGDRYVRPQGVVSIDVERVPSA